MEFIDDAEFQIAIDNDNGARITSLKWRDNEFAVPFDIASPVLLVETVAKDRYVHF